MTIGEAILEARKAAGMTQRSLSIASQCSEIYINYLETGKRKPSFKMLEKLAIGLDMDLQTNYKVNKKVFTAKFELPKDTRSQSFDDQLTALIPRLRRHCFRLCRSEDQLNELMQETLATAVLKYEDWDATRSQLYTWVYGIALNKVQRKRSKLVYVENVIEFERIEEEEISFFRAHPYVYQIVNNLNPKHREIYKMKLLRIPDKDIAEKVKLEIGTVRNAVSLIRKKLAEMIDKKEAV